MRCFFYRSAKLNNSIFPDSANAWWIEASFVRCKVCGVRACSNYEIVGIWNENVSYTTAPFHQLVSCTNVFRNIRSCKVQGVYQSAL